MRKDLTFSYSCNIIKSTFSSDFRSKWGSI